MCRLFKKNGQCVCSYTTDTLRQKPYQTAVACPVVTGWRNGAGDAEPWVMKIILDDYIGAGISDMPVLLNMGGLAGCH